MLAVDYFLFSLDTRADTCYNINVERRNYENAGIDKTA